MSIATRRIAAASIAAVVVGGSLVGCSTAEPADGSSDSSASVTGTLTIGTNHEPAMKALADAFEEANPGTKVDITNYTQDYRNVISAQMAGGNAPDIIEMAGGEGNVISAKVAGGNGFYTDLSDRSWAGDVPAAALDQFSLDDGQIMGVPMVFSSIAGIYNQGAIDAAGLTIPTTWSEVLDFCAGAKDAGKVAYGLGLSDTWTAPLVAYALVATLVYSDPDFVEDQRAGDATFSDSAWKDAMEQYMEMSDADCFTETPIGTPYSEVQDSIRKGDTLGVVSVANETANIANGGPSDLKLTYAPFPATDDADDTWLGTSASGFAVNAKAKNKDLALAFADFAATPEAQIIFAEAFGDAAVMPGDETQDSEVASVVAQFVADEKVNTWPDRLWPSTTVGPTMTDQIQALFLGSTTISDTLAKMDDAYNAQ